MKKWIAALLMLVMFMSACAEESGTDTTEMMTPDVPWEEIEGGCGEMTVSLDANETTGYSWTAFVLGGDAAEITQECYVADPNPEMLDGLGGTWKLSLKALRSGETLIRLTYSRSWNEDIAEEILLLVTVDEDLRMGLSDVTEQGVLEGTVSEEVADEHSVILLSDRLGEVVLQFAEDMALPVSGEQIRVYTNGIMTMSLPPIMNVIAWESVPGEMAR